jgi:hypothetical protein
MKLKDREISILLAILLIIYIVLCVNTTIYPISQKEKYNITKPIRLTENEKIYNFLINIFGLITGILFIVYYIKYIVPNYSDNIYLKIIQIFVSITLIIIYNLPSYYKNDTLIKISYGLKPLIISISLILSFSLNLPQL